MRETIESALQGRSLPDRKDSPFHDGERAIQLRLGVEEKMDRFARRVVRDHMPQQHQDFYRQLPFIALGAMDDEGQPWASLRFGHPGFFAPRTERSLAMQATGHPDDPLEPLLQPGRAVGVLGMEMATRRRNRLTTRVTARSGHRVEFAVDQSFGNCPQYIQTRSFAFRRDPQSMIDLPAGECFDALRDEHAAMIRAADTFFVASAVPVRDDAVTQGADVSHRGGRPGFVHVDGNCLTVPDYAGNLHFNTLGNFLLHPKAGLCFVDFETGDMLLLTGHVDILWDGDPAIAYFKGAERAWRVRVTRGVMLRGAMPLQWRFGEYSPNSLMTGTWAQAEQRALSERLRDAWRPYRVVRTVDESDVIRSFYLEPTDAYGLPSYQAGQYLTIRVQPNADQPIIRTYTLSSSPHDALLRISVKREVGGVSAWLHDNWEVGAVLEAKAPRGDFWIDTTATRPAILLAGGVGITPIVSMARNVAAETLRTRSGRRIVILHASANRGQRAFFETLRDLAAATQGLIQYHSVLSQPDAQAREGIDFHSKGHITADLMRTLLHMDDYDAYLCGPANFMQAMYDALRELGVNDARIHAEAFGPAAIHRRSDASAIPHASASDEAEASVIRFSRSAFEQRWNRGEATLLETAEAHGLTPAFSCRNGSCGTCAVALRKGQVHYRTPPTAEIPGGQALICCAVPAVGSDEVELDL
ncbi:pyridoxamine 5'-phosphate oxidase family protein [Algiphilus sp.]|uniref:2Fe-2S iron-sulfur cluster-binding protein n=1 Tax=Algiphilus sp. TaxID=1872431 RepID=UPI003B518370